MITHGGKFGKKHVAKCGKYRSKIAEDKERIVNYVAGMANVNCPDCIRKHKVGKC